MGFTTIEVRETIGSPTGPAALVFRNGGEEGFAIDGVTGGDLRRLARALEVAAGLADDRHRDMDNDSGTSGFSVRYEFDWWGRLQPWSVGKDGKPDDRNKFDLPT